MGKDVQLVKVDSATPDAGRVKSLDVIFIHGLGGDHVETWQPPSGDTWPQRVANAHPDVQVWALSYPAEVGAWLSIGDVDQPGTRGLAVLATERMVTNKIGEDCPCIFVCHSLGGLLAKRILLDAWSADQRDARRFRHEGVKAVMFCGTPHRGSAIANVLRWGETAKNIAPGVLLTCFGLDYGRGANLLARCLGKTSKLIEELKIDNVDLQHLNEDFRSYYEARAGKDFMVAVYAETKGMKLKDMPTVMVVTADSAEPNLRIGNGPKLRVLGVPYKDHSELVKPASDSEWVVEGLGDLINRVRGHATPFRGVGLLIHDVFFKCQQLLELSCFRSMIDGEPDVADASLRVARRFGELEADAVIDHLMDLIPVFDELSKYRDHAKEMHAGLSKIGCALMLASMRLHLPKPLALDRAPEIEVPNISNVEQLDLMIEVLHASLRDWPVQLALSEDRARVKPGSRVFRPAGVAPGSWNDEHHIQHLVDRILQYRPIAAEALRGVVSEPWPDGDVKPDVLVSESSLRQARRMLRILLRENVGLVLHDQNERSFYAEERMRQRINQAFEGLIVLVLPAADDTVPPELQSRLDELQIIAQRFMLKVQDTRP